MSQSTINVNRTTATAAIRQENFVSGVIGCHPGRYCSQGGLGSDFQAHGINALPSEKSHQRTQGIAPGMLAAS